MNQISNPTQLTDMLQELRASGKSIGFVPTMGALHAGHLSLVQKSKKENDLTVVSIFVNPTQFGPKEDFSKYPRPLKKDLALLRKAKVDFVFTPTTEGMYPLLMRNSDFGFRNSNLQSAICKPKSTRGLSPAMKTALPLTKNLCGKFRPGHFEGVMMVVEKLFRIVHPSRAYFGAKDYQQAAVIKKMNEGLKLGIQICVEPTVREKDGLAMSSRNQYLSLEERKRALAISKTLFWVKGQLTAKNLMGPGCYPGPAKSEKKNLSGDQRFQILISVARQKLTDSVDEVQYLEVVDPMTLKPLKKIQAKMVAMTACYVGKTRLIDNVIIPFPKGKE